MTPRGRHGLQLRSANFKQNKLEAVQNAAPAAIQTTTAVFHNDHDDHTVQEGIPSDTVLALA